MLSEMMSTASLLSFRSFVNEAACETTQTGILVLYKASQMFLTFFKEILVPPVVITRNNPRSKQKRDSPDDI